MATAKLPTQGVLKAALEIIFQIDQERAIETDLVLKQYVGPRRFLSLKPSYDTYQEALEQLRYKLRFIEDMWADQRDECEKIANLCRDALRIGNDAEFIELTHHDLSRLGIHGRDHLFRSFEFARDLKKEKDAE